MAIDLIWSAQARADLLEIYFSIGLEQPGAAERFFERVEAKIDLLRTQPRIGRRRSDIRPSLRMLVAGVYLVFYRTFPDSDEGIVTAVEIVRVVDGRRELARLF